MMVEKNPNELFGQPQHLMAFRKYPDILSGQAECEKCWMNQNLESRLT